MSRANPAVREVSLRWVVVCDQCRAGWLWRCRTREQAQGYAVEHAAARGHTTEARRRV